MGFFPWLGDRIDDIEAPGRELRQRAEQHKQRMQRAAGIGTATMVCHGDTWAALRELARYVLKVPDDRVVSRADGMVEAILSGHNLVSLLSVTGPGPQLDARPHVERAVARRVYEQIPKIVDAVDPDAAPGHPIPPIVLDDKLGETPVS